MAKYKAGNNLETDVLMVLRCLAELRVSFNCHEGAEIMYNVLKKLGYKVEVVMGFYSSPHVNKGEVIQHSWLEKTLNIYGHKTIIETVPEQVFPELNPKEKARSTIIPPNDKKQDRYHPIEESRMKEILRNSGVHIDKEVIRHLSHLVELCIDRTLEKISAKGKKQP